MTERASGAMIFAPEAMAGTSSSTGSAAPASASAPAPEPVAAMLLQPSGASAAGMPASRSRRQATGSP